MAEENSGGGLRAQLEDALAQLEEAKGQVEAGKGAQRELAFYKAGIDTSEGVGKLLAQTYDGELDPEAISTYAEEYGVTPNPSRGTEGDGGQPEQQRADRLRQESRPEGEGKRLSHKEWLGLSKANPQEAMDAFEQGRVDLPSHVAPSVSSQSS